MTESTENEALLGLLADEQLGEDAPYEPSDLQEDYQSESSIRTLIALPQAPKTAAEAAEFLRLEHTSGSLEWKRLCLKLQRTARGLPAVYPSALSAAMAVPESKRIKREDLRRGMVAYSDNPNDANPFGHIYYIAGRDANGRILTWTNDALRAGGVDIVPLDFYEERWGYSFMWGAEELNGYDIGREYERPEPKHPTLGKNYAEAVKLIEKSIKYHKDAGHPRLVKALRKDLEIMKARQEQFS